MYWTVVLCGRRTSGPNHPVTFLGEATVRAGSRQPAMQDPVLAEKVHNYIALGYRDILAVFVRRPDTDHTKTFACKVVGVHSNPVVVWD